MLGEKKSLYFFSGGNSGNYIISNTLEVATGGNCGGDYVFERPPLPRPKFAHVFRKEGSPGTPSMGQAECSVARNKAMRSV